jgi:holo-[acyl-carrier protein] synthase
MIIGVGIDIIEIDRIKKSIEKFGDLFINKIFTKTEISYCESKKNKYQHYAARFAAKEAIIKAFSISKIYGFSWHDMEIYNEPDGTPKTNIYGKMGEFLGDDKGLQISLSHSDNYVVSYAILFNKLK